MSGPAKLTPNKAAVILAVALLGGGFAVSGLRDLPAKGLEGNPGRPYLDVGGIWTDCYGNTRDVRPNRIRDEKECRALLAGEAERIAEKITAKTSRPIPAPTLAAFISFAYNVGDSAFLNSTAFRLFNAGDNAGACRQLLRWNFVDGKYVAGLANRRKIEYSVCMKFEDKQWDSLVLGA